MSLKTYKFSTVDEMNQFLAGTVCGGKDLGPVVYGLVGKTAKFTQPAAATCTFVEGAQGDGGLTLAEVKAQLEGAVSGLTVGWVGTKLTLNGGSTGVAFDVSTGLNVLGFSNKDQGAVLAYNAPDGAPPRLIAAFGYGTQMAVVVEET